MASIRKRTWQTKGGERTAWVVDYFDGSGNRRLRTFERKSEAVEWRAQTQVDVKAGEHVADRASVTVAKAADLWLKTCREGTPDGERQPLEASTLREYERHVRYITDPAIGIGHVKLNQLSKAAVDDFLRRLRDAGRSAVMARKVRTSLSSLIGHAQDAGKVGRNVLRASRRQRHGNREATQLVIPSKDELRALLAADDKTPLWFRAFLTVAIYAGLRASELRGLPWRLVDFDEGTIKVRQRADYAGRIGPPKSEASNRDVVMTPAVRRVLQELHMAQGRPDDGLVFPTRNGTPMDHGNIETRFFDPLQGRLGLEGPKLDRDGKPVVDRYGKPRLLYNLHELRHAAASLFIEQNWNAKKVQVTMGHSSIQVTYDIYGKLFKNGDDDRAAMAAVEAGLCG